MSDFEVMAWTWYCDNVAPFTMAAGMVGTLFSQITWTTGDGARRLFLRALCMIHDTFDLIRYEKMRQEARATNG